MDKITDEKHYYAGLIPLLIILLLIFTNFPPLILFLIFLGTIFIPFLLLIWIFRSKEKSTRILLKITLGSIFISIGWLLRSEILGDYGGFLDIFDLIAPILFLLGIILIIDSFRKGL